MCNADASMGDILNALERKFFFERTVGEATPNGYIDRNTVRGWRAAASRPGEMLKFFRAHFDVIIQEIVEFCQDHPAPDRESFDAFHRKQVLRLYERCNERGFRPAAYGDFNGHPYNGYAKVIDLACTHYCFRRHPHGQKPEINESAIPGLRQSIHVPLDSNTLDFLRAYLKFPGAIGDSGLIIPKGGMGSVRNEALYSDIQAIIRKNVDRFQSVNFQGHSISPLAFETY